MSTELEQKIARLERKLTRERNAREQAEELLEQKSREIYLSNQDLKEKIAETELKQLQLSYFTGLSADIWHADTITSVVHTYLKRTREFLNHADCVFFQMEKQQEGQVRKFNVYDSSDKQRQDKSYHFVEQINAPELLQKIEGADLESQLLEVNDLVHEANNFYSYCYVVPIFNIKKSLGIACFLYQNEEIDIYKLQTVESSRSMLTVAIQRKTAAISLQKRYAELKSTYEQLDDTQKQLVQSEKMASLGQLAAGVAHEINNPIGFILSNYETLGDYIGSLDELLSYLPMLVEQPENNKVKAKLNQLWKDNDVDFIREDIGDLLSASQGGLTRIRDIVSGLKSFSHADTKEYVSLDLNDCLNESIQLVWNELKFHCDIEKDLDDNCLIKGNTGQLQQVFVNLLVNAKQAMAEGGVISIQTIRCSNYVTLKLADTGSGIAKEDMDKLFTPFFTTKPVGVGTGLGLSISFGILQDHDATIEVDSEVGKGTEFCIRFPVI